jgi:hypothetical protein
MTIYKTAAYCCEKCHKSFAQPQGLARHYQASKHNTSWRYSGPKVQGRHSFSNLKKRNTVLEYEAMVRGGDIAAQTNLHKRGGVHQRDISRWAGEEREYVFKMAHLNPKSRRNRRSVAKWPAAETHLYMAFLYRRMVKGLKVSRTWLKKTMKRKLAEVQGIHRKSLSEGWATRFCKRYAITNQARNNKKHESLETRLPKIQEFHRYFIYGVQRSLPQRCPKYGRFPAHLMFAMDQVPIPFSISSKYTLNMKGHRCWTALPGEAGLDKRQMTLQLTIRASGKQVVKPVLILRGEGFVEQSELDYYKTLTNIDVVFQANAWADERVCLDYLLSFRKATVELGEVLLGMDRHSAQYTDACQQFMHFFRIFALYTPPDCTDVVSPVDDNVGQYFKRRMGEKFDDEHEEMQDVWGAELSASDRRMLMCKWASEVWQEICDDEERCETLIRRAFVRCGFLVAKDGSENDLIELDGWSGQPGGYKY